MQYVPMPAVNQLIAQVNRYAELGMHVRLAVWIPPKGGSDDPLGHWFVQFGFRESATESVC